MFPPRIAILFILAAAGLLLLPTVGLLYHDLDWSAHSQVYGAETVTPTATTTATVALTPTSTATATSTPTETPTATPTTAGGRIAGRVSVQGRANAQGVQIRVDGTLAAITEPSGNFETADVAPGMHHVVHASIAGYLAAEKTGVTVITGQTTALAPVRLRGGDADGDNEVGILDLVIVAGNYSMSPPPDPRADINADGKTDLFDLVLVAGNYRQTGPIPWP